MDKIKQFLIASLLSTSALAWVISIVQPDVMGAAMANYDPILLSLFTASWTVGMAAMMFPAISPMVLLYNKLTVGEAGSNAQALAQQEKRLLFSPRTILFVASYLLVWALAGVALLLCWSLVIDSMAMMTIAVGGQQQTSVIYGIILIISGFYQFSPIKSKCLGYCESPMSFFMRRWSKGSAGAIKMGMHHGLYCLGCCWPYFLMMVALGWMNVLWMGLFAAIIFGEKIWSKGIWLARTAGVVFAAVGILVLAGIITAGSLTGNNMGMVEMPNDDNRSISNNAKMLNDSTGNVIDEDGDAGSTDMSAGLGSPAELK